MLEDILFAIWFLLPAAVANAAPIFAAAIPALKKYDAPIDNGVTFHKHRLLGSHKTWRGIIAGVIAATIVLGLQQLFALYVPWSHYLTGTIDYPALPTLLLGPLFAIGALFGDAAESFLKRRLGIRSGGTWIPFDQIDYIIGSVLVSLIIVRLPLIEYVYIFVIWFIAHVAASYLGYKLGIKDEPI